jgi:hypothetical protein
MKAVDDGVSPLLVLDDSAVACVVQARVSYDRPSNMPAKEDARSNHVKESGASCDAEECPDGM